ncbi:Conserved oligomeric Golgi complex subunit 7 [Nakaseomyces glabratus]|uniref:Conserved oligomeric Golgi complex subunit 7 n=1 Tax=Candida glabrata TaxID=5478 RepID=A0A0W0DRJ0_CANGB|nr:hypothetical protein J7298_00024 [Nakaseomyces glabratus]KAH7591773.1 hypothetical protein J7297_00030 [Nakaseomyces glabratus]KAH7598803.1 hypothetical protein J7296_00024 [Nakaseomyces glabratus]KAH7609658.1 hypothetical protein J7295_00030 [Nakaseomyces glabratus]KAH7615366.1 hypothetical protein J7292_00026 [Nakaseomyces glabratus]
MSGTTDMASQDEDAVLKMFFDEQFVPQAFVDILLSKANGTGLNEVRVVTSGLQSRLDYYTEHLTRELEGTISSLEKISDTLPGTWNTSDSYGADGNIGSSKLEYYLDTLANAVRSLESDIKTLNSQIDTAETESEEQTQKAAVLGRLRDFEKAKSRLNEVLLYFNQLEAIATITGKKSEQKIAPITIKDFKLSLDTLQETIVNTLDESEKKESANEKNEDILEKIDMFIELETVLKDIDPFYQEYHKFIESITKRANEYINTKNIENDL